MTMSAPSSRSSATSRSASRTLAGIHLVALPVAELRRGPGRLAERAVVGRGVLGGVGADDGLAESRLVQGLADGADPAVHHVGGGDHVGPGPGVGQRRAREQRQGGVVVDLCPSRITPQWPWSVYSQRQTSAQTARSGHGGLHRGDGARDDAVIGATPPSPGGLCAPGSRRG